jgi:TetR/AcrR family transcriptional regulator, transcriptional repressor for nem operon
VVRPREFDLEEVAEGLLNTFWLRGFARTSISDLTAATKLLPGSLYAAFGSKEAMFRLAVDRYQKYLRSAVASHSRGLKGLEDRLDEVVRLTADDPERRGCLVINAIPEAASYSDDTRRLLQDDLRRNRRFVRKRLVEAQEDAGKPVDVDALAAIVFSAIVGMRVLGRAGESRQELQAVANGAKLLLRRYFRGPRP